MRVEGIAILVSAMARQELARQNRLGTMSNGSAGVPSPALFRQRVPSERRDHLSNATVHFISGQYAQND